MKIILEGTDKSISKLMKSLELRLRRNGITYKKYVEPVRRTRKVVDKKAEPIIESHEKEIKKISNEKPRRKKAPQKTKKDKR